MPRYEQNKSTLPEQLRALYESLRQDGLIGALDFLPERYYFDDVLVTAALASKTRRSYNRKRLLIGEDTHCKTWAYLRPVGEPNVTEIIYVKENYDGILQIRKEERSNVPMFGPFQALVLPDHTAAGTKPFRHLTVILKYAFLVNGLEDRVFGGRPSRTHANVACALRKLKSACNSENASVIPQALPVKYESQSVAPKFTSSFLLATDHRPLGHKRRFDMPPAPDVLPSTSQNLKQEDHIATKKRRLGIDGDIRLIAKQIHGEEMQDIVRRKQLKHAIKKLKDEEAESKEQAKVREAATKKLKDEEAESNRRKKVREEAMKKLKDEKADLKVRKKHRKATMNRLIGERGLEIISHLAEADV